MRIYSYTQHGRDGLAYSVRLLLEPTELSGLQQAGLVPSQVCEVVGLQEAADAILAALERDALLACGGVLQ